PTFLGPGVASTAGLTLHMHERGSPSPQLLPVFGLPPAHNHEVRARKSWACLAERSSHKTVTPQAQLDPEAVVGRGRVRPQPLEIDAASRSSITTVVAATTGS